MKNYYTTLWGLKIPNKIKINLWQITNNFIPTLSNLKFWKLRFEALCPTCGEDEESTAHFFHDYYVAKLVLQKMNVQIANMHDKKEWKIWLANTFKSNNKEHKNMLSSLFWAIWHNRNLFYHEGVWQSINNIINFIKTFINEIKMLDNILVNNHKIQNPQWTPLSEDQVKVNFDIGFQKPNNKADSGIIVRNTKVL